MPLVSCVDTVYCYNYDLRVAPLNNMNRNEFPPCFSCRKVIPRFLVYPPRPCYKSDKKRVCNRASVSVCALTYTYITCTSINYVDVPELPCSRPGTQPLVQCCCVAFCFFWRSNRVTYLLVFVMHALAASISMYVRTYRNSIIKCTTTLIPTAVPWGFFFQEVLFVLGRNMTPIWK